ncbi:MAG: cyanophycin synthetase [Negativicutes bacterium]|jgi:cyanophycin synthetase
MKEQFSAEKIWFYSGPSYYLKTRAGVFNLSVPSAANFNKLHATVVEKFPQLNNFEGDIPGLAAETLLWLSRLDVDLFINHYSVEKDGDKFVIAIDYLDERTSRRVISLLCAWFNAVTYDEPFDYSSAFEAAQKVFEQSIMGGPTIYSLIESALKRDIPVNYIAEENQFQWGYGKKQLRGRSTVFSTDSIKDSEFTMNKDMVKDFLNMFGFPSPTGSCCFEEGELLEEIERIGYPIVVKPLAGHKGQGVTTDIKDSEQAIAALRAIIASAEEAGQPFEGAIVEKQIFGYDHRLLAVNGEFAAGLQRVPPFVDGDGVHTIEQLIIEENNKEVRKDDSRAPLSKIIIDDNIREYLALQNLATDSVVETGRRVDLRRVANISTGGVSYNVTEKMHPDNVALVENIARYFDVMCLGIDVMTADISKSWREGNFGVIEINAGPGVFMHLVPAYGDSIDVPGKIMAAHFGRPECSRIPIIAGNNIDVDLAARIYRDAARIKPDICLASLVDEGVFRDGCYVCNNPDHDQNVKLMLRDPRLDIALINHRQEDIFDFGLYHQGADLVILENPDYAEEILAEEILPGGYFINVSGNGAYMYRGFEKINEIYFEDADKNAALAAIISDVLPELLHKYE